MHTFGPQGERSGSGSEDTEQVSLNSNMGDSLGVQFTSQVIICLVYPERIDPTCTSHSCGGMKESPNLAQ